VLLCIAHDPEARIRDLADAVGITERAVQRIIADLEAAGYLAHEREGRRNRYEVRPALPLRHPLEAHCAVGALLALLGRRPRLRPAPPHAGARRPHEGLAPAARPAAAERSAAHHPRPLARPARVASRRRST
jgi:hypothetical protein